MDIRLPKEGVLALQKLLDIGADRIGTLSGLIDSAGPSLASAHARAVILADGMGDPTLTETIDQIYKDFLTPAHDLLYRLDLSPEEFLTLLETSLGSAKPEHWPTDYRNRWPQVKGALLEILGNVRLSQEAKARSLLESRPNRVLRLGIFADVRPVFDRSGEDIYFNIITNTLSVEFVSNDQISKMYFSLDYEDLDALEDQIKRARQKAKAIDLMQRNTGVPVLRVHDQDQGRGAEEV